jgi:hypothetical protein
VARFPFCKFYKSPIDIVDLIFFLSFVKNVVLLLFWVVLCWCGCLGRLGVDFDQLALLWRSFDVLACCLQAAPEAMEIIINVTTMSRIG